jgi:hypothetical protein
MKPGDLVEWLEQALTGAVEAEKQKKEPTPRPRRHGRLEQIEAVARALGLRDAQTRMDPLRDAIDVRAECRCGHLVVAHIEDARWLAHDMGEAVRHVADALECKNCSEL